jgi:hypothetical protein
MRQNPGVDWFWVVLIIYAAIGTGILVLRETSLGDWFLGLSRERKAILVPLVLVAGLLVGVILLVGYLLFLLVTGLFFPAS